MLHVLNGDALAARFGDAGPTGERLVWREALMSGPPPQSCAEESLSARARWLATEYERPVEATLAELQALCEGLDRALAHEDEIALWFEHDLFCQVNQLEALCQAAALPRPKRARLTRVFLEAGDGPWTFAAHEGEALAERFEQRADFGEDASSQCVEWNERMVN